MPKQVGGLGIKDLTTHNKCVLMKWLWRYEQSDDALQKQVVREKHGSQKKWCTKLSRPLVVLDYGSTSRNYGEISLRISHTRWVWENHIKICKEPWLHRSHLMLDFPNLLQTTPNVDSFIAQMKSRIGSTV